VKLVDSHCHIDGERFDADRDEVIARAREAGLVAMMNIGSGSPREDSFEKTVGLARKFDLVYAAVGIHPHDASEYSAEVEERLIGLVRSTPKVVAWGEIGLDFYYDHSPRDIQTDVFRRQIRVARELGLPIIVHSRDADDETVAMLRAECGYEGFRGGVMHCFGGTAAMAEALMPLGFMISFAGNVTFGKADQLREAARAVPLGRLLIETDCPYLAPVPVRGKRNEPAFVAHTARFLAELYGIDPEDLAERTASNFFEFFGIGSIGGH
jgi:TatD DNase family protein